MTTPSNPYHTPELVKIREKFSEALARDTSIVWDVSKFDESDTNSWCWSHHESVRVSRYAGIIIRVPETKLYLWYDQTSVEAWVRYEKFLKLVVAFVSQEKAQYLLADRDQRRSKESGNFITHIALERQKKIDAAPCSEPHWWFTMKDLLYVARNSSTEQTLASAKPSSAVETTPTETKETENSVPEFDIEAIRAEGLALIHEEIRHKIKTWKRDFRVTHNVPAAALYDIVALLQKDKIRCFHSSSKRQLMVDTACEKMEIEMLVQDNILDVIAMTFVW